MKECPQCGNAYPEAFQYCPVDGTQLGGEAGPAGDAPATARQPLSISVRALMLSIGGLVLAAAVGFSALFLYQYLKPKFGSLVIKTTPAGATVHIAGKQAGATPLTVGDLRAGGHQIRIVKEGYKEVIQQVEVMPYATNSLHWQLESLVPQLTNEQLAEVESWRKRLDAASRENILLPPPDDYNVLYFAEKILAIDPANAYALEVKAKLAESVRQGADLAYAREDWLEAEKQYKKLALLFPGDASIDERLTDIAGKIDASIKDRERQIQEWKAKAEAAFAAGNLVPPAKDNALDAIRSIQRLDKKSEYAGKAQAQVRDALQNRADVKIAAGDWQGARADFRAVLQHFPDDAYSRTRLAMAEAKIAETAQAEQQRLQHLQEEQQSRQRVAALRQSAINSYRAGAHQKSIAEWQEYLKVEPNSDEAFYYIGACNQELKQLDTAILNFERSVSLNPDNVLAHLNLGLLYDRHRKDIQRAELHLRKAKDLGGAERYTPERIEAILHDLQEKNQLDAMYKVPFAVEHKHNIGFGSCRGNLRLTETGVEYKATEGDHSFYEPYPSLRDFRVKGSEISLRTSTNRPYNLRLLNAEDSVWVERLAARAAAAK